MESNAFPFLNKVSEEDAYVFWSEIRAMAHRSIHLGTSVEDFAREVEENIAAWKRIIEDR